MQGVFLAKYGVEKKFDFTLYQTSGEELKVDAVHAAGDTKIMKNEGDEANTANGFVDEGQGYSITLSAGEMEAARIVVYIVDQGSKAWIDTSLVIETYGHASAMHPFDLSKDLANKDGSYTYNASTDSLEAQKDAAVSAAAMAQAVHERNVEGTTSFEEAVRLIMARLFGKASGGGTATLVFRDIGDTKDLLTMTVDASGNRSAVTKDAS